jgi:hypothetical protein
MTTTCTPETVSRYCALVIRKSILKAAIFIGIIFSLAPNLANALPLFTRQTGMECVQCHGGGNFPELTPFGRTFKLTGYTLGTRQVIPLSGMLVAQISRLSNKNGSADPDVDFAGDGKAQLQAISVFLGGKIIDNAGAFAQITYDGVAHHSAVDNVDIRYARTLSLAEKPIVLGLTLNNNPTVADPFNTVPAWKHPYFEPGGAFQGFGAQPLVMGGLGQVTAGVGAYADWNGTVYGELAGYRNANGIFRPLRAGNTNNDPASGGTGPHIVGGTSPYWRLAVHGDVGPHSWMVGAHGLGAKTFADTYDPLSSLTKVRDTTLDAQYQFMGGGDHYVAVQGMWSRERQTYDPLLVGAGAGFDNASNTLNWRQLRVAYTYQNKYGVSANSFASSGSSDTQLYGEHTNTVPDTRGMIWELNYLPRRDMKLGLMYVAYNKFNGSKTNYDASGTFTNRNAKDNNIVSLYFWTAF